MDDVVADLGMESLEHESDIKYLLRKTLCWAICITAMILTALGGFMALSLREFLKVDDPQSLWEKHKPDAISAVANLAVIQGCGPTLGSAHIFELRHCVLNEPVDQVHFMASIKSNYGVPFVCCPRVTKAGFF